jgi:Na+/H+ antiporter NhaD/arsenite permease-like protein
LDNLTTTIVMVSLLRKLIDDKEDRLYFVGITVIAANAGGAWTPIGDVTTTMLWIGEQISTASIMTQLFIPSLISLIIPLILVSISLKGNVKKRALPSTAPEDVLSRRKRLFMLIIGVLALISVPVFKLFTHLPPFMGMLLGLGIMWLITELIHRKASHERKKKLTLVNILHKIDISSILFFLGILMAVGAMQASQILPHAAKWLSDTIGDQRLIVMSIGVLSSIVDNVPLVAAAQGMYSMVQFPMDSFLWTFLAFCAGTGGSILIIGSAAGVAAMGLEKIDFFWYVKKISWIALIGFFAGAITYMLLDAFAF